MRLTPNRFVQETLGFKTYRQLVTCTNTASLPHIGTLAKDCNGLISSCFKTNIKGLERAHSSHLLHDAPRSTMRTLLSSLRYMRKTALARWLDLH
jgi:hypothetical protein